MKSGEGRGKKEERNGEDSIIIQAKGRINPDGPPPLSFLEDGTARNRAMLVTLVPRYPPPPSLVAVPALFFSPRGKAGPATDFPLLPLATRQPPAYGSRTFAA